MLSPKSKLSSLHEELGVRLVAPQGIFMRFSRKGSRPRRGAGQTLASTVAARQPRRPLFCGEIWLPRSRCAGWIWIWAERWFEVLRIEEWGSAVAAAAVEVQPKEMADGKVPYRHARVLAGRCLRPSQWSVIHSTPVRRRRACFPSLAHVSCNHRR
jgi:hypothetical protein